MSDLLFRNSSDLLVSVNNFKRNAALLEAIQTCVTLSIHESVSCTTAWAPCQPNSSIRLSTPYSFSAVTYVENSLTNSCSDNRQTTGCLKRPFQSCINGCEFLVPSAR